MPPLNPPRDNFNFNSTATAAPPWSNLFSSPPQQRDVLANDSFRKNIAGHGGAKPKHMFGPKVAAPPNQANLLSNDNETRRVLNNIAPPFQSGMQNVAGAVGNSAQAHSSDVADKDGYQAVQNKKRSRKPPVFGTRNNSVTEKRMAGEKSDLNFSFFIGGISNQFNENDLNAYIRQELKVVPLDITINKVNPKNRSYKVTVPRKDKDVLFKPENWEQNIIIKPFRTRNVQTQLNTPNGGGEQHEQSL